MTVSWRSPDRPDLPAIDQVLRKGASPVLIPDRAGLGLTFHDGVQYFDLTGSGIAMLPHIQIEVNCRDIPGWIDSVALEEISGKNPRLS